MEKDIQKYQERLFEIKRRIDVLTKYIQKRQTTGFLVTDVEFVCLQFRKVIEEIAFLSLIANKEEYSKQYSKFETHWNARLIFQDLERINPEFYPVPSKQVETQNRAGSNYFNFEKITTGFMTKDEAIKVYKECGRMMHANNPYRPKADIKKLYDGFLNWRNRIVKLLNHHSVVLYGKGLMVVGLMQSKDDGNPHAFGFTQLSDEEREEFEKK